MNYVHGYDLAESERLADQADVLTELLHCDTRYSAGARVLEAGCGVGAQTVVLADRSPDARFTSLDISEQSLSDARRRIAAAGATNVEFIRADIMNLPFEAHSFDHAFVCFVLEHLADPVAALTELRGVIRPGGSITVIEGDHGSANFHPQSAAAQAAIDCLSELQHQAGGDALIGRRLYPLLSAAGFTGVQVTPRQIYVDGSRPELIDGFTRKTFTAMVEGVRGRAIEAGLMSDEEFDAGIRDLLRTASADGSFCYTFFKALAAVPTN
jgi:SAM-dependent methyltransferase